MPSANAAASSARIWATETIFTARSLRWRGNRALLCRRLGWLTHGWPRAGAAIVRPHGIGNSARVSALGLFDGIDDDARRWQSARFLGQSSTERFHEGLVDFLPAVLSQQRAHLQNVVFVAAALVSTLLKHVGTAWRAARTADANTWRPANAGRTQTRPHRWSRTHRPCWTWTARTKGPVAAWRTAGRRCKLGLELAWTAASPTSGTTRTAAATTTRAAAFTAQFFAAMLTARCSAAVPIKPTTGIQIISFQIPINTFTARACGSSARR